MSACATYRDERDSEVQVVTATKIAICSPDQVEQNPIDEKVVAKVLAQVPALAEMETVVAFEAGDFDAAGRSVNAARAAYERAEQLYLETGEMPEMAAGEAKLDELEAGAIDKTFSASDLKRRYGKSRRASRSRPTDPDGNAK